MVINTSVATTQSLSTLADSATRLSRSIHQIESSNKSNLLLADSASAQLLSSYSKRGDPLQQARNKLGDAISYSQTQSAYLNQVSKALNRMNELASAAQDSTKNETDRALYDAEFQQLASYVKKVATKEFNGVSLFDGKTQTITTDNGAQLGQTPGVDLGGGAYAAATSGGELKTSESAASAQSAIANALAQLGDDKKTVTESLKRLEESSDLLSSQVSSFPDSPKAITNADEADRALVFAKQSMLTQTGTAMLSQASLNHSRLLTVFS